MGGLDASGAPGPSSTSDGSASSMAPTTRSAAKKAGTQVIAASTTAVIALALQVKKSRKAYSLLFNCLGIEQQLFVQSDMIRGDAHGVWCKLMARYERSTTASQLQVRSRLHTARMLRGEKFDTYLSRISAAYAELKLVVDAPYTDAVEQAAKVHRAGRLNASMIASTTASTGSRNKSLLIVPSCTIVHIGLQLPSIGSIACCSSPLDTNRIDQPAACNASRVTGARRE